jgi:hypothetical protein
MARNCRRGLPLHRPSHRLSFDAFRLQFGDALSRIVLYIA